MKTALYRFFDADGELLYVGITHRLNERLSAHKKTKAWDEVAQIKLEHYPDRLEAELAEIRAIREESPAWNVVHNFRPIAATRVPSNGSKPVSPNNQKYRDLVWQEWGRGNTEIRGSGPFVAVSECSGNQVFMFDSKAAVLEYAASMDEWGCGSKCYGPDGYHRVFDLRHKEWSDLRR